MSLGIPCAARDATRGKQMDGEQRDILSDVKTRTDHDDDALLTNGRCDVQRWRRFSTDIHNHDRVTSGISECNLHPWSSSGGCYSDGMRSTNLGGFLTTWMFNYFERRKHSVYNGLLTKYMIKTIYKISLIFLNRNRVKIVNTIAASDDFFLVYFYLNLNYSQILRKRK